MVRMWIPEEIEGSPAAEWRGSVRDVSAQRTYYVVGTREIADYIAGSLNANALDSSALDSGALDSHEPTPLS